MSKKHKNPEFHVICTTKENYSKYLSAWSHNHDKFSFNKSTP